MSFRKLLHHAESESLFCIYDEPAFNIIMQDGECDDVTNIEKYEKEYKAQEDFKNKVFGEDSISPEFDETFKKNFKDILA